MTEPNAALPAGEWAIGSTSHPYMRISHFVYLAPGGEHIADGIAWEQAVALRDKLNDYEQEVKKLRAKAELILESIDLHNMEVNGTSLCNCDLGNDIARILIASEETQATAQGGG